MKKEPLLSDDRLLLVLHMQRKREFLIELADRLDDLRFRTTAEAKQELAEIPREIRSRIRDFDHLTVIEQQVQEFTSTFTRKLRKRFPELTPMETRVCIYIHAGLTSAQIADALFVSTRAIEKHRKSVREKFHLGASADLQEFLEGIDAAS